MNKHLCKSWLVVTSLLFLSHACGCAGHGSEIGEGGKLAGTTPKEGSHNNIEYKELEVEVRPPDGEVWIAYDAVAPSGLTTAVVSSHYRVCDSDLWQADVSKQEEVLATFESTTILDIDVKNGVVGINHPETENRISSGNLSVVAKVWSEGLGETGRSVLALSQVDTHWREDSASVGDARVHVILQVRPDEADQGCWVMYWVFKYLSQREGEANDNVGGWAWTPDVFVDVSTKVRVAGKDKASGQVE